MIDNFVASPQHKNLRQFELSESDWSAIGLVKDWLRSFRDATLEMSTTKRATLSHVHAIFKGLQDDLRKALSELPASTPGCIRDGLVNAHCKLSDYYYKSDESPYYIWASSVSPSSSYYYMLMTAFPVVLDPRIGLSQFRADYDDDPDIQAHIDQSVVQLRAHYVANYTVGSSRQTVCTESITARAVQGGTPAKRDFTARYKQATRCAPVRELEEFLLLPSVDWESCNPVQWWGDRQAQFPNLSRLARNILSIPGAFIFGFNHDILLLTFTSPGSSVAVERIFSGGRDTISLRRSSLKPETICTLMLLKNRLRLAREAIDTILGA